MKDLKISKELFSEITNSKCHEVSTKDEFVIAHSNLGTRMVNVYEFVFIKCKEWAFSQGYIISSGLTPVLGVNKDGWAEVFSSSTPLDGKLHTFKQLSEPEAIIQACEWVLDQRTNKCTK